MESVPAPPLSESLRRMPRTTFGLRCPACGEKEIFLTLFTLKERCDECGVVFEREEGAGLGVAVVAYTVAALAGLAAVGAVVWAVDDVPALAWIGAGVAVVTALATWRWSKAWWTWLLWATGLVFRDDDPRRGR